MSSILKALKRLEEEKAKRLDTPVDIASDILRQPHKRRHSVNWLALALAVCGVAVAVGVLAIWHQYQPEKLPARAGHDAHVSTSDHLPRSSDAAASADTSPAPAVSRPDAEVVEVRMPPPPVASTVNPVAEHRTDASTRDVATLEKSTPPVMRANEAPKAAPERSVARPRVEYPHLVVSGIVYQPEREARLAVVNDLPVMEGTQIEGAEVIEIFADKVRFAKEDDFFEVELGRAE